MGRPLLGPGHVRAPVWSSLLRAEAHLPCPPDAGERGGAHGLGWAPLRCLPASHVDPLQDPGHVSKLPAPQGRSSCSEPHDPGPPRLPITAKGCIWGARLERWSRELGLQHSVSGRRDPSAPGSPQLVLRLCCNFPSTSSLSLSFSPHAPPPPPCHPLCTPLMSPEERPCASIASRWQARGPESPWHAWLCGVWP